MEILFISGYFLTTWIGIGIFNTIGDMVGRKTVVVGSLTIMLCFYIAILFARDFKMVVGLGLAIGFFNSSFQQTYILGTELCTNRGREKFVIMMPIASGLMGVFPVAIMFIFKDWRILFVTLFVLGLILLLVIVFRIPESPRFLLTK